MLISATIKNNVSQNGATVSTEGVQKSIGMPLKPGGGAAVNGGELLFLSMAICFCNDVYREAAKQNIKIQSVDVTVQGEFGKEGEPASNIVYETKIIAPEHSAEEITALIKYVDGIAEVHNTVRKGVAVSIKT